MVYTINGKFGTPLAVAATYVYMFVLFGVVLFHSGGGEFFIGVAKSVAGGARGGAAKVSVVLEVLPLQVPMHSHPVIQGLQRQVDVFGSFHFRHDQTALRIYRE